MAPPAAPKSRTKKNPVAATPPAPAPAPAKKTVPPGAEVIEIPDYPTPSRSGKKGDRKRAASSPSSPIDVDEIEMWTPRQKIRVDEDCCILSADPLAAADKPRPVAVPAAAGDDDDLAVLAERGQVRTPPRRDSSFPQSNCFFPQMTRARFVQFRFLSTGGLQRFPSREACLRQVPVRQHPSPQPLRAGTYHFTTPHFFSPRFR
jgi:hypothetical protein